MVIGTVRGDVHDIGKNLVDIILTNNGYEVINIGIKQPHRRDHRGRRGAQRRRDRHERAAREVDRRDEGEPARAATPAASARSWPILLGGAALTRAYVEDDLAVAVRRQVRYARDAFEGLALMEPLVAIARGADPAIGRPAAAEEAHPREGSLLTLTEPENMPARSDVVDGQRRARAAVLGHPHRARHRARRLRRVPRRARHLHGPVGPQARPRRRTAPATRNWCRPRGGRGCATGSTASWPRACSTPRSPTATSPSYAEGDDMVVLHHGDDPTGVLGVPGLLAPDGGSGGALGTERLRFHFPRQRRDRHLCLADFVKPRESGQIDVMPVQLVTAGAAHRRRSRRRCSPRTSTATTSSSTASSCSSPSRSPSSGTRRIRAELGLRGRGPGRRRRAVQARLPRRPLLARLPGLPRHGGPPQGGRAAQARADGRGAVGGAAAASGAVDRRVRVPPPGGEVLLGVSALEARRPAGYSAASPAAARRARPARPRTMPTTRGDGAHGVPGERRRHERVEQERAQVLRRAEPRARRRCRCRPDRERPEPQVHDQAERVGRDDAVDGEHGDLERAAVARIRAAASGTGGGVRRRRRPSRRRTSGTASTGRSRPTASTTARW